MGCFVRAFLLVLFQSTPGTWQGNLKNLLGYARGKFWEAGEDDLQLSNSVPWLLCLCSGRWQLPYNPFSERAIMKEPSPPQPGMEFYHMRSKTPERSDHVSGFFSCMPFNNKYFNTLTNLQNHAKVLKSISEIADFVERLLQILHFHPKLYCASWKLSLAWLT